MRTPKIFIGQKLREIRDDHGLTQAKFAEKLGLSTSYLNQLENNQRHVTASVLLALAEHFQIDITSFSEQDSDRLLADLVECFADPLFKGKAPATRELRLATHNAPSVARALITMHQALRRAGDQLAEIDDSISRAGSLTEPTPYEEVRDYFHFTDNYVHKLDVAAEKLAESLAADPQQRIRALQAHLDASHHVRTEYLNDSSQLIRHYDATQQVLKLNGRAGPATHAFHLAHQIALLEHAELISDIVSDAGFRTNDARDICSIGLANYFAGATLMPYKRFLAAARELRHDLADLGALFDTSLEQTAHRLSTLQRPGKKGVPIFFARIDRAGNITKRHSATKLQFARFGSACPLWNAHKAFETPGQIIRQLAETPDGVRYLCLAWTVDKPTGGYKDPTQRYALAMGCETDYIEQFVYGDNLSTSSADSFEHIGVSCRICERENCLQRAVPPLKRQLHIDANVRKILPYSLAR